MMQVKYAVFLLILTISTYTLSEDSNLVVTNYHICAPNAPIKVGFKFNKVKEQLLNMSFDFPYNIDERLTSAVDLYKIIGSNQIKLITLKNNKGPCAHLNELVGPMWHELEKKMHLIPGSCPLPKGKYNVFNHRCDTKKMRLTGLPIGEIAVRMEFVEKATGKLSFCAHVTLENK